MHQRMEGAIAMTSLGRTLHTLSRGARLRLGDYIA
jgi:hypothetical protein